MLFLSRPPNTRKSVPWKWMCLQKPFWYNLNTSYWRISDLILKTSNGCFAIQNQIWETGWNGRMGFVGGRGQIWDCNLRLQEFGEQETLLLNITYNYSYFDTHKPHIPANNTKGVRGQRSGSKSIILPLHHPHPPPPLCFNFETDG